MLKVDQTLSCDICGAEIATLSQTVHRGTAIQYVDGASPGVTGWRDVCSECFGDLSRAFVELRRGRAG